MWQVSITILDENDNSPEFDITSDSSVEIPENTPIGKRVAVVLGRDKDAGNNALVRERERLLTFCSAYSPCPLPHDTKQHHSS